MRYLIHSPAFAKDPKELQEAWAAMEAVQASGQAKSIGVSNFRISDLETILQTAKVVPAINQIEFHLYLQRHDLVNFHKQHGIATESYGPLTPITKASPGPADSYLAALAEKYAVNEGEILLRWCIDQDIVAVTTSAKEQRMSDMLRVTTFKLTPKEIQELSAAGAGKHYRGFMRDLFGNDDRQ